MFDTIGQSQNLYLPAGGGRVEVVLVRLGSQILLGFKVIQTDPQTGYQGTFAEGLVDLTKGGFVSPVAGGAVPDAGGSKVTNEDLADMLRKVIDWKKNENGVYLPTVEAGDTVIVDKPNSAEIRVLDVKDQTFEKIPKKAVQVKDQKVCVCPLRDIMMGGCRCGGG